MKTSRRNLALAVLKAEKANQGKPPVSKYEAKRRASLVEAKQT